MRARNPPDDPLPGHAHVTPQSDTTQAREAYRVPSARPVQSVQPSKREDQDNEELIKNLKKVNGYLLNFDWPRNKLLTQTKLIAKKQ